MRRHRLLLLCLLLPACVRPAAPSADAGAPRLQLAASEHDFGTVTEGDQLRHVFEVKNTGSAPLVIERVSGSCGCTVAKIETRQIQPGGTGRIEARFDTSGRSGAAHTSITIVSNDRSQPAAAAHLRAQVERLLAVAPVYLRLDADYGAATVGHVWFTGRQVAEARPKVALVESEGRPEERAADDAAIRRALRVTPVEEDADGKPRKGLALHLKGDRLMNGHGRLLIDTGLPRPAQLEVRLRWKVAGNLEVDPPRLHPHPRASGERERVLRVWSKRKDLRIKGVRVLDGPWEAVLDRKPDPTGKFHITVGWPQGTPDPSWDSALEISSNDPIEPRKRIPLRGLR